MEDLESLGLRLVEHPPPPRFEINRCIPQGYRLVGNSNARLLRKREVGQWKDVMDEQQVNLVDEKTKLLAPLGLD